MRAILQRLKENDKQTTGAVTCFNEAGEQVYKCNSLELADNNNKSDISRIPKGIYKVITDFSTAHQGQMYEITGVPDRTGIRIDVANYYRQLKGCIAIGQGYSDLDNDGYMDVLHSSQTNKEFREVMGDSFIIEIKDIEYEA